MDRVPVLYIAGSGRSGSTLLERMLGGVEGFLPVGELRFVWQRGFEENHLCSCGAPFRSCPFWNRVLDEAFGGLNAVDHRRIMHLQSRVDRMRYIPELVAPRARRAGFRRALAEYSDVLLRLYRGVAAVSGAATVVDSSKEPPYAFVLRTIPGIDLFVAHLVRDSRAVAYSWQRKRVRPEIAGRVQYMRRYTPAVSAHEWNRKNGLFELLARTRTRVSRLRYEDLTADPAGRLSELLRTYADGRPVAHLVTGAAPALDIHSVSGNPIRFERGALAIRPDMEWRTAMDPSARRTVQLITLPLLARYGYLHDGNGR